MDEIYSCVLFTDAIHTYMSILKYTICIVDLLMNLCFVMNNYSLDSVLYHGCAFRVVLWKHLWNSEDNSLHP
jgi:hypothetical protein